MIRHLLLSLLVLLPAISAAEPPADLKPFQGKWVLRAATLGGRDHTDDYKGLTLTVAGDKYTVVVGPNTDAGTLTVDAKKSPKWLTLASSEPKGRSRAARCPASMSSRTAS